MRKKAGITLFLVVVLAALLRFYQLGKNPPSLNLDEVAIGYNAYSILKTGRDEYGARFPLSFRSHDDYKPPVYIYLTALSVAIFDLNPFAVRFPSALAGILTVLVTYFLVAELFSNENSKFEIRNSKFLPVLAAGLLAISPWHLQFSRTGFETNVAVFFVVSGTWAFIKGMKKQTWWYLTAICFALSMYTYQTARLFIPLFSIALVSIFSKSIFTNIRKALPAALLFFLLVLPLIPFMTSTAGVMRFKGTSVFEHPGLIQEEEERIVIDAQSQNRFAIRTYHNRALAAFLTVVNGYLTHFRPDVLFLGMWGPPVNYTPNVGLLYLIELPLIILGIHRLANLKEKKVKFLIISWIILSPIAAAFTIDIPRSTRMMVILPTLQILSALGLVTLIIRVKQLKSGLRILAYSTFSLLFFLSFLRYLHQYYVHAPLEFADAWQYGYKQAVEYADRHLDEYEKVIVSTNLRQPQNFFAFYTSYDPATYIFIDGGTVSGGFLETGNRFGKFEFHPIDYENLDRNKESLLIDLYERMHSEYRDSALEVIKYPNGEPIIAISRT